MGPVIRTKIHACNDLIRMDLAPGAGFFLVAGLILASGGLPPGKPGFFQYWIEE